jgi:bacteriorhodopsin
MIGAIAWFAIIALLFNALQQLPQDLPQSVQSGVRTMSFFVILGWAIYPAGYMAPLMEVPPEVRELVYNIGDLANKLGLTLVVYATAKRALWEEEEAMEEEQMAIAPNPVPAEAYGQPGYAQAGFAQPSGYSTMLPQGGE